ncbi:MAG: hypothetical protein WA865_05905, partial [Spirulinaceae cyanobacterium]
MSEADLPNNSPQEPLHPLPEDETLQSSTEAIQEENESVYSEETDLTVDFSESNAISEEENFALSSKLRQRNRVLLKKVATLERTLAEAQEALQAQEMRTRGNDNLLAQQAEEFSATQEQLTRLFRELESSHQTAQRQQILIETLSQQLESAQERINQLEQEYTSLQKRNQTKAKQLLQQEQQNQELRSRLQRQQRRAIQFKTALDKCLDVPNSSSPDSGEIEPTPTQIPTPTLSQNKEETFFPKASPIQPWSAQLEQDSPPTSEWLKDLEQTEKPDQKNDNNPKIVPLNLVTTQEEEEEVEMPETEIETMTWQPELVLSSEEEGGGNIEIEVVSEPVVQEEGKG